MRSYDSFSVACTVQSHAVRAILAWVRQMDTHLSPLHTHGHTCVLVAVWSEAFVVCQDYAPPKEYLPDMSQPLLGFASGVHSPPSTMGMADVSITCAEEETEENTSA